MQESKGLTGYIKRAAQDGRLAVLVIFCLLALWGVKSYNDYGLAVDDLTQRRHSLVTYKDLFLTEEYETETIDTKQIATLGQYRIFYGVALQLPLVFVEHIFGFQLSYARIFEIRHAYTYLWFMIAAFFFYRTCILCIENTEKKRWLGICGLLIFLLCPRVLADANYNIKDMLCFPMYTIAMYYGTRVLKYGRRRDDILFGITAAVCTSVRIVGGSLAAALCIVLLCRGIAQKRGKRALGKIIALCYFFGLSYFAAMPVLWVLVLGENWKRTPWLLLAFVLLTLIVREGYLFTKKRGKKWIRIYFAVLTGAAVLALTASASLWVPLAGNVLKSVKSVFSVFGNYTLWGGTVLYMGERIYATQLPWNYIFVWIFISIPLCYTLLFLIGQLGMLKGFFTNIRKWTEANWVHLFLLLLLWIPLGYILIVRPVLYNGWRHMYFLYNVIALTSVIGLRKLFSVNAGRTWRLGVAGVLALSFAVTSGWILKNHPYEYTYFNPAVRNLAADNFERDCWGMTEQECFRYILAAEPERGVYMYAPAGQTAALDTEKRLYMVESWEDAEYIVMGYPGFSQDYYFFDVYDVKNGDGMLLSSVWKRFYKTQEKSAVIVRDGELSAWSLGEFKWRQEEEEDFLVLIGEAETALPTDKLAFFPTKGLEEELYVSFSSDGVSWFDLEDVPQYKRYENRLSGECATHDLRFLQLRLPKQAVDAYEGAIKIKIEFLATEETKRERDVPSVIAAAGSSDHEDALEKLYDNNFQTWWESGRQTEGTYVELRLEKEETINGVILDYGDKYWDYPRDLQIEISKDGKQWDRLDSFSADNQYYSFASSEGRYIRLSIGTEYETESNWSIYEIYVLTES